MVNYRFIFLTTAIFYGTISAYNVPTNLLRLASTPTLQLSDTCINIDYDGIVAEDVPPFTQFKAALKTVPFEVTAKTLFWNLPTLVKACFVRLVYGNWFYDQAGNKLMGHDDHLRIFAKNYPGLEPYCSKIITALAPATPLYDTIAWIQQCQREGAKVVVWTNNDEPMYLAKKQYSDARLTAEGKEPLHVDGYFVIGSADASHAPHISHVGKPDFEYYKKAFAYSQSIVGDTGDWEHYFIDDKLKNVVAPNEYAKQTNINLTALHHPNFEQFTQNVAAQTSLPYTQHTIIA